MSDFGQRQERTHVIVTEPAENESVLAVAISYRPPGKTGTSSTNLGTPWIFVGGSAFLADGDNPFVGGHAQRQDLSHVFLSGDEELHAAVVHAMHGNLLKYVTVGMVCTGM